MSQASEVNQVECEKCGYFLQGSASVEALKASKPYQEHDCTPVYEKDRPKPKEAKKGDIPRFVLSLTDTHHTIEGPKGAQYFNVTVAVDDLVDFWMKSKDPDTGKMKAEIKRVFEHFGREVKKMDETDEEHYTPVEIA